MANGREARSLFPSTQTLRGVWNRYYYSKSYWLILLIDYHPSARHQQMSSNHHQEVAFRVIEAREYTEFHKKISYYFTEEIFVLRQ